MDDPGLSREDDKVRQRGPDTVQDSITSRQVDSNASVDVPTSTSSIAQRDTTTSGSHRSQFSSISKQILERAKGKPNTPAISSSSLARLSITYDDVKREHKAKQKAAAGVESSASLPQTLPLPTSGISAAMSSRSLLSFGGKRKRDAAGDEPLPSPSMRPSATPSAYPRPAPARLVPKPVLRKKKAQADNFRRCEKCDRTASTASNTLVTCSSCFDCWHQACHEPRVVADESRFKCAECVKEDEQMEQYWQAKRQMEEQQAEFRAQSELEQLRDHNLEGLPDFNKTELVGFGAGKASTAQRRKYFASLKQSDLVNLLLFADAVQGGLLLDVVTEVTGAYPSLPLFGHPEWPNAATASAPTADQPNNPTIKPQVKKPKTSAIRKVQDAAVLAQTPEMDMDEAPLPPAWPKTGHGLYARLPPEHEDDSLLRDNKDDEEAFSHYFVDGFGRQAVGPVA